MRAVVAIRDGIVVLSLVAACLTRCSLSWPGPWLVYLVLSEVLLAWPRRATHDSVVTRRTHYVLWSTLVWSCCMLVALAVVQLVSLSPPERMVLAWMGLPTGSYVTTDMLLRCVLPDVIVACVSLLALYCLPLIRVLDRMCCGSGSEDADKMEVQMSERPSTALISPTSPRSDNSDFDGFDDDDDCESSSTCASDTDTDTDTDTDPLLSPGAFRVQLTLLMACLLVSALVSPGVLCLPYFVVFAVAVLYFARVRRWNEGYESAGLGEVGVWWRRLINTVTGYCGSHVLWMFAAQCSSLWPADDTERVLQRGFGVPSWFIRVEIEQQVSGIVMSASVFSLFAVVANWRWRQTIRPDGDGDEWGGVKVVESTIHRFEHPVRRSLQSLRHLALHCAHRVVQAMLVGFCVLYRSGLSLGLLAMVFTTCAFPSPEVFSAVSPFLLVYTLCALTAKLPFRMRGVLPMTTATPGSHGFPWVYAQIGLHPDWGWEDYLNVFVVPMAVAALYCRYMRGWHKPFDIRRVAPERVTGVLFDAVARHDAVVMGSALEHAQDKLAEAQSSDGDTLLHQAALCGVCGG